MPIASGFSRLKSFANNVNANFFALLNLGQLTASFSIVNAHTNASFVSAEHKILENGVFPASTLNISMYPVVGEGLSNTGGEFANQVICYRNHFPENTDKGTCSDVRGLNLTYGHNNGVLTNSPGTTNLYGLRLNPVNYSGTIFNLYDLYINSVPVPGAGTNTNRYGIFIADVVNAVNNFAIYTGLGRVRFGDHLIMANAKNFQFSTTTGTIIAQASNQKMSFWGAVPIIQPSGISQAYSQSSRFLNAYPAPQGGATFAGIDNAQAGTIYAKLADLNFLYGEVQSIRSTIKNLVEVQNTIINTLKSVGLISSSAPPSDPPSFIGISSVAHTTSPNPIPLAPPTGTQEGDLMIAYICRNYTTSISISGWTLVKSVTATISSVTCTVDIFYKFAASGEATTNFPSNAGSVSISISSFRNISQVNPIQSELSATYTSSTSYGLSNIGATAANSMLFIGCGIRNAGALAATNNWTPADQMVEAAEVGGTASLQRIQTINYQLLTAAQTGITKTLTGPSGGGVINALVLNPK